MTLEVSHALMSSLKDALAGLQLAGYAESAQNKSAMRVTSDVSHVEMWPYISSADALSETHAATAVRMVASSAISGVTVGAGVIVGLAEEHDLL